MILMNHKTGDDAKTCHNKNFKLYFYSVTVSICITKVKKLTINELKGDVT